MEYGGNGYINPDDLYVKEPKFIKEKEKSNLIRLVSTKLGQTHCTITPVFAKLILFCKSRMVAVDGFNGSEENC